ncbi:hypothetical protein GYA27_00060 [candidate division WWE3 bacterium]|uniref:Uncharacterized protein n=1 Tax=candidate division WWE3 bacterium TaxID=2053526 RepID=A0A7X9DJK7_UNCKA|nr:hypothetical protein [candidate division WWE3 bacterium]
MQGAADTTHYCSSTGPATPGDGEVLDRYCSGGQTCYVAGSTPQYQCGDLGGECVDYPQDCIDTGGILDDEPVCSGGATCCLPDNGPTVTCTGTNRTCIPTAEFIANGVQCPSGFPDPNFTLSCGYDYTCCEARESCTPTTANGCYEYQPSTAAAIWVCDACGDGGCGADRRCAPTSSGGYACVPCTVNDTCNSPGQCNEVAGCGPGERCHEYTSYSQCEVDPECGQQLLLDYPYQGPIVTFNDLLSRIYSLLYPIGIALGLFFIAKAGYTIMMSEGNPTKISQGKEELTSAVLGTLFILLSLVILRVIIRALLGATI